MAERWVINASPLIVLARIGREDFLFSVTDHVVIPRAVALEIAAGPADDRSRQLVTAGRFRIVDTPASIVISHMAVGTHSPIPRTRCPFRGCPG